MTYLESTHAAQLAASAIAEHIITERGYRSITPGAAADVARVALGDRLAPAMFLPRPFWMQQCVNVARAWLAVLDRSAARAADHRCGAFGSCSRCSAGRRRAGANWPD